MEDFKFPIICGFGHREYVSHEQFRLELAKLTKAITAQANLNDYDVDGCIIIDEPIDTGRINTLCLVESGIINKDIKACTILPKNKPWYQKNAKGKSKRF